MELLKPQPETILFHYHCALLVITNVFFAVFLKCIPAFVPFVIADYSFSYSFVTHALAIAFLTDVMCIIILPPLLNYKSNIVCFFICISACIGTAILWYFHHQPILFIVGLIVSFNAFNVQWGLSNSMISSFVSKHDKHLSHVYLTLFNYSWTLANILFIPIGYILKYETFWVYLECIFFMFALLAVLNLFFMPKISVNKYNLLHHSNLQLHEPISLLQDLKILFSLKIYRIILLILILTFTTWSWYYLSFSYWIQQLYNLNASELGIATAFIEGVGNTIAIVMITCIAQTNEEESDQHKRYKMRLEHMMIAFAVVLCASMILVLLINYVVVLQYLLEYKYIVYSLICGYFIGSEGVITGALIMTVTETPPSQQARSSAIVSIIDSLVLFLGQNTVGFVYTYGGFKLETPFLVCIQILVVISTLYLAHHMGKNRSTPTELSWINENKHNNPQYTCQ